MQTNSASSELPSTASNVHGWRNDHIREIRVEGGGESGGYKVEEQKGAGKRKTEWPSWKEFVAGAGLGTPDEESKAQQLQL